MRMAAGSKAAGVELRPELREISRQVLDVELCKLHRRKPRRIDDKAIAIRQQFGHTGRMPSTFDLLTDMTSRELQPFIDAIQQRRLADAGWSGKDGRLTGQALAQGIQPLILFC